MRGGGEVQGSLADCFSLSLSLLRVYPSLQRIVPAPTTPPQTLLQITTNILQNPQEIKYTKLKQSNPGLKRTVLDLKGGREFLVAVSVQSRRAFVRVTCQLNHRLFHLITRGFFVPTLTHRSDSEPERSISYSITWSNLYPSEGK